MAETAQIIRCPKCGANNRVVSEKIGQKEAVCGRCKTVLSFTAPIIVTDANFAVEVEKSALPVLVDFWATWCPPCRMIAPVIENLAKELAGKVRVGKLDVDQNQIIAGRFRVQSIPTLIIFKDGREAERIVGAQSREAILQKLKPFIS